MTVDTMLSHIQEETEIDSDERAREALKATLETFGARIDREEAKDLAGHLPDDIETWIIDWDSEQAQAMSVDAFLQRVADELDVSEEKAQQYVHEVMNAIEEEFTLEGTTELRSAQTQLPEEYKTLF